MKKISWYIILLLSSALYSSVTFCTKYASLHSILSPEYILGVLGAVVILGLYAISWQQIIRKVDITLAYMFKSTGLIFTLLICYYIFAEHITTNNLIGSAVIIVGITMFAWADGKEKGWTA